MHASKESYKNVKWTKEGKKKKIGRETGKKKQEKASYRVKYSKNYIHVKEKIYQFKHMGLWILKCDLTT